MQPNHPAILSDHPALEFVVIQRVCRPMTLRNRPAAIIRMKVSRPEVRLIPIFRRIAEHLVGFLANISKGRDGAARLPGKNVGDIQQKLEAVRLFLESGQGWGTLNLICNTWGHRGTARFYFIATSECASCGISRWTRPNASFLGMCDKTLKSRLERVPSSLTEPIKTAKASDF